MANIDLKPYLNKFITVTIDDGKEESGFIANPDEFRNETRDDSILVLLNGLLNAEVRVSRIVAVRESVREDTVKIPIVGYDKPLVGEDTEELSLSVQELLEEDRKESESIRELLQDNEENARQVNAAIDELFDKSFSDTMDVDVTTLLMPTVKDDNNTHE